MNKKVLIIFGVILLFITVYIFVYYIQRSKYDAICDEMEPKYMADKYSNLFDIYYDVSGEYPTIIDSVYDIIRYNEPKDDGYEVIRYESLQDHFAPLGENIIYYPIYDRKTKKRDWFVILSVGIDGRRNDFLSDTDSLFHDDWWTKLNFYDKEDILSNPMYKKQIYFPFYDFSLWRSLFGKKDYLIQISKLTDRRK